MHFDGEDSHATITEIYGDKEFLVYAPEDTPYMYPSPKRANHSLVDDRGIKTSSAFRCWLRRRSFGGFSAWGHGIRALPLVAHCARAVPLHFGRHEYTG